MHAFFLPAASGQRFCIFHAARRGESRGAVIYLHPFAEEMNKSRRMAALTARAMAEAGYDVLQIDLLGCGDSSGDFSDASWQAWREDVVLAHRWLRGRSRAPLTLWGLRLGCLLASSAAADLPESASFLFWQPVIAGRQHWEQFMRLKMAAALSGGAAKEVMAQLRQQLSEKCAVEIAGYTVAASLAESLEQSDLSPPARPGNLAWLALSSRPDSAMSTASQSCLNNWRSAGFEVEALMLQGPSFWQTSEIEVVPALVTASVSALARSG